MSQITRRHWMQLTSACAFLSAAKAVTNVSAANNSAFALKYLLASPMYGYERLEAILPEVVKTGATAIDIWPKVHGNQREQLSEMGEAAFLSLLQTSRIQLGCITQYPLGPFRLKEEISLASRLGCHTLVTGGEGPKGLKGNELKKGIQDFVEKMKPHLDHAAENDVVIAIENHANNIIDSPDSLKYLMDFRPNPSLGIAFAPYHLEQDSEKLAQLIRQLGDGITIFYAWQHGNGCMQAQPKESELLQMPGRGSLDFKPIVAALKAIEFQGWTEIFMHPFPRGVPILETTDDVTAEINRARAYLESLIS